MTAFKTAEFYEILGNAGGRLEREGSFLLEALAEAPSTHVADLACGLGLHALFLAEHGGEVHAFDLSPEMIDHARNRRPHPNLTYTVGDMCTLSGGPYGLVLCLGNSLCLLDSAHKVKVFFQGVHGHLLPGGLCITQTLNYETPVMKRPRIRVEGAEVQGGEIAAIKRFLPEGDHTHLSIDYLGVALGDMLQASESFTLYHWNERQLSEIAENTGLQVKGCYGGYDRKPFREDTPDMVLITQKP
ncbi:MAG: dTDP-3-amino-3,6-dideoxy-alpha-D-glucopyranose N,N-dimethyltransferase [Candidatus Hydrogenedentes bacterium ADurb.Bin101]|jgi:SAM-dependent methyltransferase|nr:class I SAM-dependent methyltransferase [Candidatus Hydrogenedentota bacterium]OQC02690.1 MAG: dTDP-3-amino-3,6-dideoxy-alpha-D-glucopyranose N,N-dimethyltransferase [Candidatus Hydrogenedentes bacterium ADurb.Bin101]HOC70528.1 class I SAM-dependent methyltransferase [Candidatus Hydrogenedentota bacterium]